MDSGSYGACLSTEYDQAFTEIPRRVLRWFPWIGKSFGSPEGGGTRLLLVGESHYGIATDTETVAQVCCRHDNNIHFTREILWEQLISGSPGTCEIATFARIASLFFGDAEHDHVKFWGQIAFMNLVQRTLSQGNRPAWDSDYVNGWEAVHRVLSILEPDHCVVLGTESHHRFWSAMHRRGVAFDNVMKTDRVGWYWGYRASIMLNGSAVPIEFVKHPGRSFSTDAWHSHLSRRLPKLFADLHRSCVVA